jgi:hypothetical protein
MEIAYLQTIDEFSTRFSFAYRFVWCAPVAHGETSDSLRTCTNHKPTRGQRLSPKRFVRKLQRERERETTQTQGQALGVVVPTRT